MDFLEFLFDVLPPGVFSLVLILGGMGGAVGGHVFHDRERAKVDLCNSSAGRLGQLFNGAQQVDCGQASRLSTACLAVEIGGLALLAVGMVLLAYVSLTGRFWDWEAEASARTWVPPVSRERTARPPFPAPVRLASYRRRAVARIIDSALIAAVGVLVVGYAAEVLSGIGALFVVLLTVVWALLYEVFYVAARGQTLGKRIVDIWVVQSGTTGPLWAWGPSFRRAFLPYLGALVLVGAPYIYMSAFRDNETRRGLHDAWADTLVIRGQRCVSLAWARTNRASRSTIDPGAVRP